MITAVIETSIRKNNKMNFKTSYLVFKLCLKLNYVAELNLIILNKHYCKFSITRIFIRKYQSPSYGITRNT